MSARHHVNEAFTINMIDPNRYMVMWSKSMACFIRWTWMFPTRNEKIT